MIIQENGKLQTDMQRWTTQNETGTARKQQLRRVTHISLHE